MTGGQGARIVWGMEIRSAVAGAFATVVVAGLAFTAGAVSNAQEAAPPVDAPSVAVVGHYSTTDSLEFALRASQLRERHLAALAVMTAGACMSRGPAIGSAAG